MNLLHRLRTDRGFAMLMVLSLSTVLFLLLSAAVAAHYTMRRQNDRQQERLQEKINRLEWRLGREE